MTRTYSSNNNIYSVDMMFSYLDLFDHDVVKINIDDLIHSLEYKGWANWVNKKPKKSDYYSAMDVINNQKKYKKEMVRINDADLKYPIIIYGNNIVDGVHRLAKAYLLGKKYINAHIFDRNLMRKFLINNKGNWKNVDNIETSDYIKLFIKRFI